MLSYLDKVASYPQGDTAQRSAKAEWIKEGNMSARTDERGEMDGDQTNAPADVVGQNVDVVQRCYAAVGRGDIPAVLDLVSADVDWTLQGPPAIPFAGTRRGRAGVAEFFSLVGGTLEFHQFEPREFVAQGDSVVAIGYEHSLVKPTGRALRQEWVHVYTMRNGKIATFRGFEDTAALVDGFGG